MSSLTLAGGIAGGVGLFLLGMWLMTDGLKLAAGPALERVLANSTKTRLRGLTSGIMVTAVVQSSTAVTVATIGFVNAGLMNLSQALWVLFGANVGTTMTGWLVALVGLQFKIEALALPLIGIGMVLRLTGERSRRGALGMAVAGFGVLFLGIDLLKESFTGLADDFALPEGDGVLATVGQVLIGMLLTVLMQSSSASLTIALTAAQGGLLTTQGAAAVVIGANIGTTLTAVIAAIGATSAARRAAAAHIIFNLLTGVVALMLLPWLIALLALISDGLDLESSPAAQVALFHTAFNVLGVILIWPLAARLTRFLESRFRVAEEDDARPRYIDRTVLAVTTLALSALEREVRRMGGLSLKCVASALSSAGSGPWRQRKSVEALGRAIAEFIVEVYRAGMSGANAQRLPELLRAARYYEAAAVLAVESADAAGEALAASAAAQPEAALAAFRETAVALLGAVDPLDGKTPGAEREAALRTFEVSYQDLKAELLRLGATGALRVGDMDALLRSASALRRALEQLAKAAQLLGASRENNPAS